MLASDSNVVIDRVGSGAPMTRGYIIGNLAKIEFTAMVVMTFLTAGHHGEHLGVPAQNRRPGCGILVPLPKGVIFHLVHASSFDAAR